MVLKQRIILRADASKKTGYGHFVRSLALAGYLKDKFDCYFASYNAVEYHATEYQLNEIDKVCTYLSIDGSTIDEFDENFLSYITSDDIVILDNYYFSTDYQRSIKCKGCRLVCIDDMHNRHMVSDMVMTSCPLTSKDFSLEPYTRFVGGIKWAFLRAPFLNYERKYIRNGEIRNIVLAIGGADPFNLTDKMLGILLDLNPCLKINVIAGDTVSVDEWFKDKVQVFHRISAEEIVDLFDKADLGVFPASTICIEAFACRLPVAVGYYVDNQEKFYINGVEHNCFAPLGCLLDDAEKIKEALRSVIQGNHRPKTVHIDFAKQKQEIVKLFLNL